CVDCTQSAQGHVCLSNQQCGCNQDSDCAGGVCDTVHHTCAQCTAGTCPSGHCCDTATGTCVTTCVGGCCENGACKATCSSGCCDKNATPPTCVAGTANTACGSLGDCDNCESAASKGPFCL